MTLPLEGRPPAAMSSVADAVDVRATTLLGVSTSLKPAPGARGRSAARALLVEALSQVGAVCPDVRVLDLRDHPVPMFDGRAPEQVADRRLRFHGECVRRAGALLISVPAYWSGVSGVFKNFVDVLCGPAYDLPKPVTSVFTGRPVGLLIVGADHISAERGAEQAAAVMDSVGARLVGSPIVVGDPRAPERPLTDLLPPLVALAGRLAIAAQQGSAGDGR